MMKFLVENGAYWATSGQVPALKSVQALPEVQAIPSVAKAAEQFNAIGRTDLSQQVLHRNPDGMGDCGRQCTRQRRCRRRPGPQGWQRRRFRPSSIARNSNRLCLQVGALRSGCTDLQVVHLSLGVDTMATATLPAPTSAATNTSRRWKTLQEAASQLSLCPAPLLLVYRLSALSDLPRSADQPVRLEDHAHGCRNSLGLANYQALMNDKIFWEVLGNTF